MSNFDSDLPADNNNDWEDRGDLAWNEFDWERFLRAQDETLLRYLGHYEQFRGHDDRIDRVAAAMGWDQGPWADDDTAPEGSDVEDPARDSEPYTVHKNPVYIATKALCLSLRRNWELVAVDLAKVPQRLAVHLLATIHRAEDHATLGVQALDLGDYAMAISLFKRGLAELNVLLALLNADVRPLHRALAAYREDALGRVFDLREIWLRVTDECRDELASPMGDGDDEDDFE